MNTNKLALVLSLVPDLEFSFESLSSESDVIYWWKSTLISRSYCVISLASTVSSLASLAWEEDLSLIQDINFPTSVKILDCGRNETSWTTFFIKYFRKYRIFIAAEFGPSARHADENGPLATALRTTGAANEGKRVCDICSTLSVTEIQSGPPESPLQTPALPYLNGGFVTSPMKLMAPPFLYLFLWITSLWLQEVSIPFFR